MARRGQPRPPLLVRLGAPSDPERWEDYGPQLQPQAVAPAAPEARVVVEWVTEETVELVGGERVDLRRPAFTFEAPSRGALDGIAHSPRATPPMHGLGLLEAIPERALLERADPEDADGDGVSGRPHMVSGAEGAARIGRFGWKAAHPTLLAQNAAAFSEDLGITTALFPEGSCAPRQLVCRQEAGGGEDGGEGVEVERRRLEQLTFYTRHLAVPARRVPGARADRIARGEARFDELGCAACHVPSWRTGGPDQTPSEALWDQRIWPYTDLLLHDVGPGLADGRAEGQASGREWRTPPLWGLGLTPRVNGHMRLLHDGRARGPVEAILWHGGEAEASRRAFEALGLEAREELVAFLRSI